MSIRNQRRHQIGLNYNKSLMCFSCISCILLHLFSCLSFIDFLCRILYCIICCDSFILSFFDFNHDLVIFIVISIFLHSFNLGFIFISSCWILAFILNFSSICHIGTIFDSSLCLIFNNEDVVESVLFCVHFWAISKLFENILLIVHFCQNLVSFSV